MKSIFTPTLTPDEQWFNSIQNLKFNDGCGNGEYPRIGSSSLNTVEFKKQYYGRNSDVLTKVQFLGGLRVPSPSTPLSPINNQYLQSALSTNQLNVTAPGTWIQYRNGVLTCPKRARVTVSVGLEEVSTVFGLNTKTWLVNFVPNAPAKDGISYGSSSFTISGVPNEPLNVNVTRNPNALGGQVDTVGYNFIDWQHDSTTSSLKINLGQNNAYLYSVAVVM